MTEHKRYSWAGSPAFEAFLAETLNELGVRLAATFDGHCLAVILGGGYGRGEGACVLIEGTEHPYNDFDLFVVTDKAMELPPDTRNVTKQFEQRLHIEVDVGKPLSLASLSKLPHSLMWQDLLDGHKVMYGQQDILTKHMTPSIKEPLPKIESLRLLLNRGSGLLQAIREWYACQEDAHHELSDPDFIRRNYQKCALSLGDALLIASSAYKPPLSYRTEQVSTLQDLPSPLIVPLYQEAAAFKVNPDKSIEQPTLEQLLSMANLWVQVLLHTEAERTGKRWSDIGAYAHDTFLREREQHTAAKLVRNAVKQAKLGKISYRYPRESLYGMLGCLLSDAGEPDRTWNGQTDAFLRVWRTCN